ncbi:histone acetyltransferase type B catalytic subunit [Nymphaea colorata]|nr:histone acetyltransferase type B catalytic subunit [Nymphaea colorata]
MVLKKDDDARSEKKRRKVNFSTIDVGVEANDCIKFFLVSSHEEMDRSEGSGVQVDMNQFFGEDGKIYGYKDLKIHIWLSIISYHAYAVVTFESKLDGSKGITNVDQVLKNIFGESLISEKDDFAQTFSRERHYIRDIVSTAEVLKKYSSEDEVVRLKLNEPSVGKLYSRLIPVLLLLVEGSSPVDTTDPRWEIYLAVRKAVDQSGDIHCLLLGFATIYHFYHYPDASRLRIGQILVLPPYQGSGHGRQLLESVNAVAVSGEDIYDVTIEEPSEYLQHLRDCVDTVHLLSFEPIKLCISSMSSKLKQGGLMKKDQKVRFSPSASIVEEARKGLKITKKQFRRCWDVLVYLSLDPNDSCSTENFKTCLSNRLSSEVFEKDSDIRGKCVVDIPNKYGPEKTFVMFRSNSMGEASTLSADIAKSKAGEEEQLKQLVEVRMKEIVGVADKVAANCKKLGIQPFQ